MRVGMGYDVHKLVEGRDLIIGGVKIPYEKGLLGHSDADVLLHAISDALLGAAALGDIGKHFPDTDPKYKGADSLELLKEVGKLLDSNGYVLLSEDEIDALWDEMASDDNATYYDAVRDYFAYINLKMYPAIGVTANLSDYGIYNGSAIPDSRLKPLLVDNAHAFERGKHRRQMRVFRRNHQRALRNCLQKFRRS